MFRKIAIAGGALTGLLLILLITVPVLYRDRIAEAVRGAVDEAVSARVDWQGARLSLIRSFPHLGLELDDVSITGVEDFEGDTLVSIHRLRLVLDLPSVWRNVRRGEPVIVRSIDLDRPALNLYVLEDGTASWESLMPHPRETEPDEARALDISLRHLAIRAGSIVLDDGEAGLFLSVGGFDQSLRGDFTRDHSVIRTQAHADEVSLRFSGVPYLHRVRLDLTADVAADMVQRQFTFRENELRLNDLSLAFSGSAGAAGEDLELDLTFGAPATDFRHLLSLVPAIYARDFESLRTSGTMAVSGRIEGRYGPNAFPSFALHALVEDGTFRYPDLPLPAREIALELSIENPGGDLDRTVVEVPRFHVVIGNDPVEGALALRTPISDPDVELRLLGRLDLADLRRTVKLDDVEEMAGIVSADASLRTRMSFIDAGQYDRITADGGADARNVAIRAETLPNPVLIEEAALRLSPRHAELTSFRGSIGDTDFRLTGSLDNLLGYALGKEDLRGRAKLDSRRFDLNQWRSDAEELGIIPVPANVAFTLDANVAHLSYGTLEMTDALGVVHVEDRRVTLQEFRTQMLGGEVVVGGLYDTADPGRPMFDLDLRIRSFDIQAASGQLSTLRALAPVAEYARGQFSAELALSGLLGADMIPVIGSLSGRGSLETSQLALEDFPGMMQLADAVGIPQLSNPMLNPVHASFDIRDGRLHVRPFEANVGDLAMVVAGSNGIDESLDYAIRLRAPRAVLGSTAERAITGLLARAGRAGVDLDAADLIELGIRLTGTVSAPSISTDVGELLALARDGTERAVREGAERAVQEEGVRRLEQLETRAGELDAAARAEAERILRTAEERAAAVREEAQRAADAVSREGHTRADSLVARATDPIARAAARVAADRLRSEADGQANRIVQEADEQAERIIGEAERLAAEIIAAARSETDGDPED